MSKPVHLMRWVGSKRRFADRLLAELPDRIESYCAPFGGSLADVFALIAAGRFTPGAKVVVSDVPVVRDLYTAVKDERDVLTRWIAQISIEPDAYEYSKELMQRSDVGWCAAPAALLVLNQLAFNGLYRVNRKGEYNVPRDPKKKLDADALIARVNLAHEALQQVNLIVADGWRAALLHDCQVYYADPPYLGTYNSYSATPFTARDHAALAKTLLHLRRDRGSVVVASNSNCAETRELYPTQHWKHMHLSRANNVTCDAATRGNAVTELLMVAR